MYIGVSGLPTLFLLFVLAFTHNDAWLTRRNVFLLCIQPILSTVLFWTNGYHHLFYLSLDLVQENGFLAVDFVRGPWYLINIVYSYTIIGFAFLVLSQCALRWSPLYLNQYRLILVGSFIPWAASAYSEFYFTQWHGLDLAPLMFGLSGIIYVFAIFYTHFMDLIPIARSLLIENMRDGVLVLDLRNRIMDINPAMESFLEEKISFLHRKKRI